VSTWNGAISHGTINDPLVELFFKSVRNIPCTDYRCITVKESKKAKKAKKNSKSTSGGKNLESYFDAAWAHDPLRTLKFVFYLRDCRGGKGERKLFRALVHHMCARGLIQHVLANLQHIPTFGSWKDVSICCFGTPLEGPAIQLIANQLRVDKTAEHPSLCAKYAPSEGGAIDKAHKASSKIAEALGVNLTRYRKRYLSPLRSKLNVVEKQMCAREWNEIEYGKVTSIAGMRYKKAFQRHDEQRYTEYLNKVQSGEKKMNVSVLMPHQIVSPYLKNHSRDETIEAQWTAFLKDRREKWPAGMDILPLVDVSGSMFPVDGDPQPGEVAVSLGLLVSLLNSSAHYRGKFITFDSEPKLLSIQGTSLYDQVKYMKGTPWGMSTNVQKAFDLILGIATTYNVPQSEMPKILLILSDMQFDQASGNNTNWSEIELKYAEAGYQRPIIIFWNLNGTTNDFPVPSASVPNCMLLSGYNDVILYSLLEGTLPNPIEIIHTALDKERYDVIQLAKTDVLTTAPITPPVTV
jgi:Mg-chelatase subunit ChlD